MPDRAVGPENLELAAWTEPDFILFVSPNADLCGTGDPTVRTCDRILSINDRRRMVRLNADSRFPE